MAQAGGGGGGGWGDLAIHPVAPAPAGMGGWGWTWDGYAGRGRPDGSTDGYSGRGWGEHCDDEPIEPLGGGWRLVRLDDPWIPGGRLWQGPLQRGEDDSFRGYQR